MQIKNVVYHFNSLLNRNNIIISIDAEKTFGKVHQPFTTNALKKLGIEGTALTYRGFLWQTYSQDGTNLGEIKAFSLQSGMSDFSTLTQYSPLNFR